VSGREHQITTAFVSLTGSLAKGDDVVSRIAAVTTDPQSEVPLAPVVIESVKIASK